MITANYHALEQSAFYRLKSPHKLAELLGVSMQRLQALLKSDDLYNEFDIKKKSGGIRRVEAPCRDLKAIQSRIAKLISRIQPGDYLFCPVKGRCYVKNAAQHRNSRVIRCLDITKFFPNTPRRRVYWFFATEMQCAVDVAGVLAKLATYKGHLPTGSPLSPIMAHYAYIDIWRAIADIARTHQLTLTVYVDDVTISGLHVSDQVIWEIKQIIHGSGLRYHKEKKFVDHPAEVTGIILKDGALHVPNRQHLKMHKAKKDLCSASNEIAVHDATSRLYGLAAQKRQIERVGERLPRY